MVFLFFLKQHAGLVQVEHFDAQVLQQIRRMNKDAVDVTLHKLLNKPRERMQDVRRMPAYFMSFFRSAADSRLQ
jgi:hypothetical protein